MRLFLLAASLFIATPALAQTQAAAPVELFKYGVRTGTNGNPLVVTLGGSGSGGSGGASAISPVSPTFSGGANLSVSAAASYTPFPAQTCKQLTVANNTGVTVQVQQGGSGAAQPVFPGTYYVFYGLTDASALAVERADGTATAVNVNARCEY